MVKRKYLDEIKPVRKKFFIGGKDDDENQYNSSDKVKTVGEGVGAIGINIEAIKEAAKHINPGTNTYTYQKTIEENPNEKSLEKKLKLKRAAFVNANNMQYIGGNNARDKFFTIYPKINNAVDSVAKAYGISPDLLKYRLKREGFVDDVIREHNDIITNYNKGYDQIPQLIKNGVINEDSLLHSSSSGYKRNGFKYFGLDYIGALIEQGKVKTKGENWYSGEATNENNVSVPAAFGETNLDNLGLMAANLVYAKSLAKKDFPNLSGKDLERAASVYYNMGPVGAKQYIINNNGGHKFIKGGSIKN